MTKKAPLFQKAPVRAGLPDNKYLRYSLEIFHLKPETPSKMVNPQDTIPPEVAFVRMTLAVVFNNALLVIGMLLGMVITFDPADLVFIIPRVPSHVAANFCPFTL